MGLYRDSVSSIRRALLGLPACLKEKDDMDIPIWLCITPVQERDEGQPTLALRTAPYHRGGHRACGTCSFMKRTMRAHIQLCRKAKGP